VIVRGQAYCLGPLKRGLDLTIALGGLLTLAPILLALGLLILLTSGWPVLFTQERIGLDGRRFRLVKLRSMRRDAASGLPITGSGDPRVTRLGRLLRATKLDEVPQLVNVLRSEMSVVGPRPEIPRYVARYSAEQLKVLTVRPGLTDPASVLFLEEERLLGAWRTEEREDFYLREILPRKLRLNLQYLACASFWYDLRIVFETCVSLMRPRRRVDARPGGNHPGNGPTGEGFA
jgi:lipopolysaccharide/colanic/teichoic acid biosynthesis glycosyltransferase